MYGDVELITLCSSGGVCCLGGRSRLWSGAAQALADTSGGLGAGGGWLWSRGCYYKYVTIVLETLYTFCLPMIRNVPSGKVKRKLPTSFRLFLKSGTARKP